MNYTDVFGGSTVPPSEYAYRSITLVSNRTLEWPDNYSGNDVASAIMNVTSNVDPNLWLMLPPANEASVGRDLLFRNVGSQLFTIKDRASNTITTVLPGEAKYVYLTSNTTASGAWSVVAYGVGASTVDAGSLVGYGIKAIGTGLNQSHPTKEITGSYTVLDSDRAKLIVHTGGTATVNLPTVFTVGDDFFLMLRNSGSGTLGIKPFGTQTIDGIALLQINPGESLMVCSSGLAWFTVGYGRATEFNFTQLTKDVSAAGTFTLTAAEAANKLLTFVGNPTIGYTVVVPPTVQVYYVFNNVSSLGLVSATIKTPSGTGVEIPKGERLIVFCDGVNVYSAASTDSFTTIINTGESGFATARFAYTEEVGGNNTVIVPYSGFVSMEVYVNGELKAAEYNDYELTTSGNNTICQFAFNLNITDRAYFVLNYLADLSRSSFIETHVFTATAGQTTFTWTSGTLGTAAVLAFINGIKQTNSYVINGTSIVFDEAVPEGALVDVTLVQNVQETVTMVEPVLMMQQEINTNVVIPPGYNALSVDPTINAVVTVSAGSVWAIVGD